MPLHGYSTDRRPPTNLDHMLAHPYAIGLAAWQILAGALVMLSLLTEWRMVSSAMTMQPTLVVALAATLVVGGVNVIRGLLDDSDDLRRGFRVERGGLILSGSGWLAYATAVLIANPGAALSWSMSLIFTCAIALRGAAGWLEERRIARALDAHNQ